MKKSLSIVGQDKKHDDHGHDHHHDEGSSCGVVQVNVHPGAAAKNAKTFAGRAAVITLGCAKNQVDSEVMLGVLKNHGFEIVTDLETVDVAVVNTCSFLESSIKESIDTILEISHLKESARLRKLIVAGCLVGRFGAELKKDLPEVDAFLSIDDILKVGTAASEGLTEMLDLGARPYFIYDDTMPRCVSTGSYMAYVKVSEGCNRPCAFCIIPKIRGAMRSRPIPSVVSEVRSLGEQGIKEVNLIAQDLTSYGTDLKGVAGAGSLAALIRALNRESSVPWIRLLYAYPVGVDEDLLKAIVESERVCNYLDIPLQHASENMLKLMKRPMGKFAPRPITEWMRSVAPEVAIRTTFIVGFPGETEDDIRQLEEFVGEGHFLNVGVFTYSREPGTPAFDMPGQVPEKEKKLRRARVMEAQQRALLKRMGEYVGTEQEVLVTGAMSEDGKFRIGRTRFQAPEVDGTIVLPNRLEYTPGSLVTVRVASATGYDLVAEGAALPLIHGGGAPTKGAQKKKFGATKASQESLAHR